MAGCGAPRARGRHRWGARGARGVGARAGVPRGQRELGAREWKRGWGRGGGARGKGRGRGPSSEFSSSETAQCRPPTQDGSSRGSQGVGGDELLGRQQCECTSGREGVALTGGRPTRSGWRVAGCPTRAGWSLHRCCWQGTHTRTRVGAGPARSHHTCAPPPARPRQPHPANSTPRAAPAPPPASLHSPSTTRRPRERRPSPPTAPPPACRRCAACAGAMAAPRPLVEHWRWVRGEWGCAGGRGGACASVGSGPLPPPTRTHTHTHTHNPTRSVEEDKVFENALAQFWEHHDRRAAACGQGFGGGRPRTAGGPSLTPTRPHPSLAGWKSARRCCPARTWPR